MPGVQGPRRGPQGPRQWQQGSSRQPATFDPPPGLWINGVEYTSYLLVDSPNITNSGYPQTGGFKFRLEG